MEKEKITCSRCGGEKISRDKEIPIFANCADCGFSWNLFSNKMVMRPGTEEVVNEHIKQFFASVDAGLRGQWLASLAKIITGPEMKIALQKIDDAVVIQRRHVPTGKTKWNYILDLNEEK